MPGKTTATLLQPAASIRVYMNETVQIVKEKIMESELPPNERGNRESEAEVKATAAKAPAGNGLTHTVTTTTAARSSSLGPVFVAAVLIMAGALLLASNFNLLPNLNNADIWDWMILGVGALLVFSTFVRAISPDHQVTSFGGLIIGMILIGWGLNNVFAFNLSFRNLWDWWPLLLIIIGISSLTKALKR